MKSIVNSIILILTLMIGYTTPVMGWNEDFEIDFGGQIALQYSGYFGDEDPENGFILPDDEYLVRKAAFLVEGRYGKYITFEMEIGSERCPFSGSDNARILEANLLFNPTDNFSLGLSRGHVLRGYLLNHDCTDLLAGEKVRWSTAIAACHPTGFVMRYNKSFDDISGIDLELSYNNGLKSETVEDEHDINIGCVYHTPLKGFDLSGFYTDLEADFDLDQNMDSGRRIGVGARYEERQFVLGGEYYMIDGTASAFESVSSEDLEMRAWYVETAYKFITGDVITYLQPYLRYQFWDKGSNAPGDNEYQYLDSGISMGLGGYNAFFRVEYQTRIGEPDNAIDEEDKLILRLQINL